MNQVAGIAGKSLIALGFAILGIAILVRQLYVADYNPCERNSPLTIPLIGAGFLLIVFALLLMITLYYRSKKEKISWGAFSVLAMIAVMYEYWMFYLTITNNGYLMYCTKSLH